VVGEIIANAIAASATDSDNNWYEPDRLLQIRPDAALNPPDDSPSNYRFSLNPDRIGAKLIGLIKQPIPTRASTTPPDLSLSIPMT
jgi:hypothetical protein